MKKIIITDLDNTIYDWITFFAKSFEVMVKELSLIINIKEDLLLNEFKIVHQYYNNIEQPFAILELPSVKKFFGNISRTELTHFLDKPLHAFNSARKKYFHLYDNVESTLSFLHNSGFAIIGYSDAAWINSYYRLCKLGICDHFSRLYIPECQHTSHPHQDRENKLMPPKFFIRNIPKTERKPNPKMLNRICTLEDCIPEKTLYIGDSLTRDISMAKEAGLISVWAKYGNIYDKSLWEILIKISHWSNEDVERENQLHQKYDKIRPDYTINSFSEVLNVLKDKNFI